MKPESIWVIGFKRRFGNYHSNKKFVNQYARSFGIDSRRSNFPVWGKNLHSAEAVCSKKTKKWNKLRQKSHIRCPEIKHQIRYKISDAHIFLLSASNSVQSLSLADVSKMILCGVM